MAQEENNIAMEYDESKPDTGATKTNEFSTFGIEILKIIKDSQAQHGLRHGDFQRYHGYCNRRLFRLRKVVGLKLGDKKRVFPKKITDALLTDHRYLLILLMTIERAWSFAMQLKHENRGETRSKHHMIRRLRKAANLATEFNQLCLNSNRVDGHTKLESQAYSSYINGLYLFELKKWQSAMEQFTQTQTIYEKMCEALTPEEYVPYKHMIEELSPNIRYCAYNIGDQSAINDLMHLRTSGRQDLLIGDKLDSLIVQAKAKKAASMSEIKWKSYSLPIKHDKVRVFFIALKEFNEQIDSQDKEAKLEMYEGVLSDCKDAVQCVKDEIKIDPSSKVGGDNAGDKSNLQLLLSYLTYIRIEKTIKRNLLLIDNLKNGLEIIDLFTDAGENKSIKAAKPSDFIRIYDIVLQNLTEIPTLIGLTEDKHEIKWVNGQVTAFKAIKCFYIAQAYVSLSKWQEGIALYERVLQYANDAIKIIQSKQLKARENFVNLQNLEELIEVIAFNKYRVHASAIMQTSQESLKEIEKDKDKLAEKFKNVALMDRLDEYYEDSNLLKPGAGKVQMTSSYPPNFQPIPCKPLFFDLALNHLSFPSLEDKMAPKGGQKAGISGYFKGWLGWGSKK